jgi:hypothetical protein
MSVSKEAYEALFTRVQVIDDIVESGNTSKINLINNGTSKITTLDTLATSDYTLLFPPTQGLLGEVLINDGTGTLDWGVPPVLDQSELVLVNNVSSNNTTLDTAATSDYALVFPTTQGANGEVLTNDGSGQLTWESSGGGGSSKLNVVHLDIDGGLTLAIDTGTYPDNTLFLLENGSASNMSLTMPEITLSMDGSSYYFRAFTVPSMESIGTWTIFGGGPGDGDSFLITMVDGASLSSISSIGTAGVNIGIGDTSNNFQLGLTAIYDATLSYWVTTTPATNILAGGE